MGGSPETAAKRPNTDAGVQEQLRKSRVALHEHWTLYLCALSSAGGTRMHAAAAPFTNPAVAAHVSAEAAGDSMPLGLTQHLAFLWSAVSTLCDGGGGADATAADRCLRQLTQHPPGIVTDDQERNLAAVVTQLQQQAAARVPDSAFFVAPAGAARPNVRAQLEMMWVAIERSVSAGVAELQEQLAQLSQQTMDIAEGQKQVLSAINRVTPALQAIAYGGSTRDLAREDQQLIDKHTAAVERDARFVVEENVMICPASRLPFTEDGNTAPTVVPGCGCVVARDIAVLYQRERKCGICDRTRDQLQPGDPEDLHTDDATLVFLEDLRNNRVPAIPQFDVETDFVEDAEGRVRRAGKEGGGALRHAARHARGCEHR